MLYPDKFIAYFNLRFKVVYVCCYNQVNKQYDI